MITMDSNILKWIDNYEIDNSSKMSSSILFKDTLYCFCRYMGNLKYFYSKDGIHWTKSALGTYTDLTSTSIVFNDKLYFFHPGDVYGISSLWYTISPDGINWSQDKKIEQVEIIWKLAASVFNGRLYLFFNKYLSENELWYTSSSDGLNWEVPRIIKSNLTSPTTSLIFNNTMYCFYSNQTGFSCCYSTDGTNWAERQIKESSAQIKKAIIFNNILYLFYEKYTDNISKLFYITSKDGINWDSEEIISENFQYSFSFDMTVFQNRIYCFKDINTVLYCTTLETVERPFNVVENVDEYTLNNELDHLKDNIFAYFPLKNDCIDYSATKMETKSSPYVKYTPGRLQNGNAADFTADQSFIRIIMPQYYYVTDYAISCWINISRSMSKTIGTIIGDLLIDMNNGHLTLNFNYCDKDKVKKAIFQSKKSLSIDTWYHIIITYNHPTKKLVFYIDGEIDSVHDLSMILSDNMSIILPITETIGGNAFKGYISDVIIFTSYLNPLAAKFLLSFITDENYTNIIGKKRFALFTILIFALVAEVIVSVIMYSQLPDDPVIPPSTITPIDIIGISDLHGRLESTDDKPVTAVMAASIKKIYSENPNRSLVLGVGDLYTGTPLSLYNYGEIVMQAMNSIKMEATALGNHEFDWGLTNIINKRAGEQYYLCANLLTKSGETIQNIVPYKIVEKDGIKIAIIGAITQRLIELMPQVKNDYKVDKIAINVNNCAKLAKTNGANIVIAVIHEGTKDKLVGDLITTLTELENVDFVLGGHSHNEMIITPLSSVKRAFISEENGKSFIHLRILYDKKNKSIFDHNGYLFKNKYYDPSSQSDAEVKRIVSNGRQKPEVSKYYSPYLSNCITELLIPKHSPALESTAGDFVTDLIRTYDHQTIDFAFYNNGGLRDNIPTGNVCKANIYYLVPFNNYVMEGEITKDSIKIALEFAASFNHLDEIKKYGLQISGLKVKYDFSKPIGQRVIKLSDLNNYELKPNILYKVRIIDYLYYGGDNYNFNIINARQLSGDNICDIISDNIPSKINVQIDNRITFANFSNL